MNETAPDLAREPEVLRGTLDMDALHALFDDLEVHAEVLAVTPKTSGRVHAAAGDVSLAEALELLRASAVFGVQIRYRFDGSDWLDTLIVKPDEMIDLFRFRQDQT